MKALSTKLAIAATAALAITACDHGSSKRTPLPTAAPKAANKDCPSLEGSFKFDNGSIVTFTRSELGTLVLENADLSYGLPFNGVPRNLAQASTGKIIKATGTCKNGIATTKYDDKGQVTELNWSYNEQEGLLMVTEGAGKDVKIHFATPVKAAPAAKTARKAEATDAEMPTVEVPEVGEPVL